MAKVRIDKLVDDVTESAVFLVSQWRDGTSRITAQILHHAVSVLSAVGLPASDPLVAGIDKDILLLPDFDSELGLCSLAIARVATGGFTIEPQIIARLSQRDSDLSFIINGTPFGRAELERLMLVESLALKKQFVSEEAVAVANSQVEELNQKLASEHRALTYPLMLCHLLGHESNVIQAPTTRVFETLLQVDPSGGDFWYGNNLALNSLVVCNAMRCHTLSEEFRVKFWNHFGPGLTGVASRVAASIKASHLNPDTDERLVRNLGPFARMVAGVPLVEHDAFRGRLSGGSKNAFGCALKAIEAEETKVLKSSQDLKKALQKAIAESLSMDASLEELGGGLSKSKVFVANASIDQPIRVSGHQLLFKTDSSSMRGKEKKIWDRLVARGDGLADSFAGVLGGPDIAEIDSTYYAVILYEYLAGYRTLRDVLGKTPDQDRRRRLFGAVVERLMLIYRDTTDSSLESDSKLWATVVSEISGLVGTLTTVKVKLLQDKLERVCKDTTEFLKATPSPLVPVATLMHGDLNCRNIMLRLSVDGQLESMKLIDYETLVLDGDYLFDLGELIEDAGMVAWSLNLPDGLENFVGEVVSRVSPELGASDDFLLRLRLGRLRSVVYLTRSALLDGDRNQLLSGRALDRWDSLLLRLQNG